MKYSFYDLDERIIKTRLALSGALFEMIKRNKHIKVLDVCRNASITPMTYYHHFNNKTQLIDYSVKKQLENILPIPAKLKPINIKHLVFYLIKSFTIFAQNNQQLIYSSILECKEKGYQNSYLYYLDINISSFVKKELSLLLHNNDLLVDLWNNIICGCLFKIFSTIVIKKIYINSNRLCEGIKLLISKLM